MATPKIPRKPNPKVDHTVRADPVKGPSRDSLNGEDQNAYDAILAELRSYGLESLAPDVLKFLQEGYGEDTIALRLQETKAYRDRFSANESRVKAGLRKLSPAEYLSMEDSYRQVMRQSGLPTGFYDANNDFTGWIASDVSPTEVQARVASAKEFVFQFPGAAQKAREWYALGGNEGDLIAYALDPSKAQPLVDQRIKALEVGSSVVGLNRSMAERVGASGIGAEAIRQGAGVINQTYDKLAKLAAYDSEGFSVDTLAADVFLQDANAALTRDRLTSRERNRFSGSGGVTDTSLSGGSAGAI